MTWAEFDTISINNEQNLGQKINIYNKYKKNNN